MCGVAQPRRSGPPLLAVHRHRLRACATRCVGLCYVSGKVDSSNKLSFGDNLSILREHVPDASVDPIYLDPPFNSSAIHNVLCKEKSGVESVALSRHLRISPYGHAVVWTTSLLIVICQSYQI
jgi:hypothetical protein